jgi:hypothetical protein
MGKMGEHVAVRRDMRLAAAFFGFGLAALPLCLPGAAQAQSIDLPSVFAQGKLLGTGGVNTVSGASGGGIVQWALIGGYDTDNEIGGNAFYTHLFLRNFNLNDYGGSLDFGDRVEVSLARQNFQFGNTGITLDNKISGALGAPVSALPASLQFGNNFSLNQDIIGAKVRLFGNVVYDQGALIPEVSVGYQFHHNENQSTIRAIGSKPNGNEYYVAATKLWIDGLLGHYTIVTATLDVTNAVQNGLLGFGGLNDKNGYHVEPEFSAGWFVTRNLVIGGEYRFMPHFQQVGYNGLGNAWSKNQDWKDAYLAYFLVKDLSLTLAYADLGDIGSFHDQHGLYLSLNGNF